MPREDNYPELINLLSSISQAGFTQLQAKAYVNLLKLGESTGSSIAEESGISRSKIYDILNHLEKMRAVKRIRRENKAKYIANDPDILFKSILDDFNKKINTGIIELDKIKDFFQYFTADMVTLTSLDLKSIELTNFEYLISSSERTRGKFLESIGNNIELPPELIFLNLDIQSPPELLFLIGKEELLLFEFPKGEIVKNALHFNGKLFFTLFQSLIQSSWELDFPEKLLETLERNGARILFTGKAINVFHMMPGFYGPKIYPRPVSFIITNTHISFYYENVEDLKIPISVIKEIEAENDEWINCKISVKKSQEKYGSLKFKIISRARIIKGIVETVNDL